MRCEFTEVTFCVFMFPCSLHCMQIGILLYSSRLIAKTVEQISILEFVLDYIVKNILYLY